MIVYVCVAMSQLIDCTISTSRRNLCQTAMRAHAQYRNSIARSHTNAFPTEFISLDLVHVVRLDRFNSTTYRADSRSKVDVLRCPEYNIKRELVAKKITFGNTEIFVEVHSAAKWYLLMCVMCLRKEGFAMHAMQYIHAYIYIYI